MDQEQQAKMSAYADEHNLSRLFEKLTEDVIRSKPSDLYEFLIARLKDIKLEKEKIQKKRIVFVLGGPGSGKGTQCELLVKTGKFQHFSAGDLLRAARQEDTAQGRMIANHIKNGTIVPGHVTIALLRKAILEVPEGVDVLIDGFPREMKQARDFERQIVPGEFVLFFDCSEECMTNRLLKRGETSGRVDDREDVIKKRFQTYQNQTFPVIEFFKSENRLRTINSEGTKEEISAAVKKLFNL